MCPKNVYGLSVAYADGMRIWLSMLTQNVKVNIKLCEDDEEYISEDC